MLGFHRMKTCVDLRGIALFGDTLSTTPSPPSDPRKITASPKNKATAAAAAIGRNQCGITVSSLANAIGTTLSSLSKIENLCSKIRRQFRRLQTPQLSFQLIKFAFVVIFHDVGVVR
ncbi:MAG: helix-turn-helix transcriptional regulator, partial [Ahrensia sp.]|nr:helix-turn-helix transcriptional regulator [Ahrensia sp.]